MVQLGLKGKWLQMLGSGDAVVRIERLDGLLSEQRATLASSEPQNLTVPVTRALDVGHLQVRAVSLPWRGGEGGGGLSFPGVFCVGAHGELILRTQVGALVVAALSSQQSSSPPRGLFRLPAVLLCVLYCVLAVAGGTREKRHICVHPYVCGRRELPRLLLGLGNVDLSLVRAYVQKPRARTHVYVCNVGLEW